MAWYDYFKEARRDRQGIFLEFTDEELKKQNQRRFFLIILIFLTVGFSWTGVGAIFFFGLFLYNLYQMNKTHQAVNRRYLKKKDKARKK